MCYVHNQWYDISCATLYILKEAMGNTFSVHKDGKVTINFKRLRGLF